MQEFAGGNIDEIKKIENEIKQIIDKNEGGSKIQEKYTNLINYSEYILKRYHVLIDPELTYNIQKLVEKLKEYMKGQKRYNGELYEFTLKQGFLPKHTNEIFYNWQNNEKLEVINASGEKARKKSFYIVYNYYKDDNKKVNFNLK